MSRRSPHKPSAPRAPTSSLSEGSSPSSTLPVLSTSSQPSGPQSTTRAPASQPPVPLPQPSSSASSTLGPSKDVTTSTIITNAMEPITNTTTASPQQTNPITYSQHSSHHSGTGLYEEEYDDTPGGPDPFAVVISRVKEEEDEDDDDDDDSVAAHSGSHSGGQCSSISSSENVTKSGERHQSPSSRRAGGGGGGGDLSGQSVAGEKGSSNLINLNTIHNSDGAVDSGVGAGGEVPSADPDGRGGGGGGNQRASHSHQPQQEEAERLASVSGELLVVGGEEGPATSGPRPRGSSPPASTTTTTTTTSPSHGGATGSGRAWVQRTGHVPTTNSLVSSSSSASNVLLFPPRTETAAPPLTSTELQQQGQQQRSAEKGIGGGEATVSGDAVTSGKGGGGAATEGTAGAAASGVVNDTPTSSTGRLASSSTPHIGSVGLVNEGCTCYLNSLLQLLFHTSFFRTAVYRIPVEDDRASVYKALQDLFFQMQERTTPARTKKLTDSFGWGEQELYVQHDIQEMATLLRDNLESKMKGTVSEGAINQLFEGLGEQFVETLDKTYISRSRDTFYDIHLPLSEYTTLMDSLRSLTARDQLVGDNKYRVEREGVPAEYKDAEKGYEFKRFPPVTWFHLKRFAMDLTSPTLEMKKVNSRMEFPVELDLTELERGLSQEEWGQVDAHTKRGSAVETFDRTSRAIYDLHGVIVHRGTVRSGHYYCYIRDWDPELRRFTRWIEFEDENVRVVDEETAVMANYGGPMDYYGHRGGGSGQSSTGGANSGGYYGREPMYSVASAYILSYVRRADAPKLLAPSPTDIIPQRVKDAMRREMEEEERRARREQEIRQSLTLYIVTDQALERYCSAHQLELLTRDSRIVRRFADCVLEVKKSDPLSSVYEAVAAEPSLARRGITESNCRLWRWTNVRTFHPSTPLPTYSECSRHSTSFRDHLLSVELDKPLVLCLYVQESLPCWSRPIVAAADPTPFIRRFHFDESSRTCSVTLKAPTSVTGCVIQLEAGYHVSCKVHMAVTTNVVELPLRLIKVPIVDDAVHVALDPGVHTQSLHFYCVGGQDILVVRGVHFEVAALSLPPPLPLTKPTLAKTGQDRILLFFKLFDHTSCTVHYVGSMLMDRVGTLGSCEALYGQLLGYLSVTDGGKSGGSLAYFEEGKGTIQRELNATRDLADNRLTDGAVIVAQLLDVPPVYRHLTVETYYRTVSMCIDIRVLEVVAQVRQNDGEVRQAMKDEAKKLLATPTLVAQQSPSTAAHPEGDGRRSLEGSARTAELLVSPNNAAVSLSDYDPAANPFNTTLPVLHPVSLDVVSSSVCRMLSPWTYDSVCDAIAAQALADPSYLRLYHNANATDPAPEEDPVRTADFSSLDEACQLDQLRANPVLFFERLNKPRAMKEKEMVMVVTLRDAVGHALHRERYVLSSSDTVKDVLSAVRQSIQPWELTEDRWGTLQETLTAPHFVLLAIDKQKRLIRDIKEVSAGGSAAAAAGGGGGGDGGGQAVPTASAAESRSSRSASAQPEHDARLDVQWSGFEFDLMPMPPLRPHEQRIACCHGEYRNEDAATFGHPFVITVLETTSVEEGLEMMLKLTHMPFEALSNQQNYAVMMLTSAALHFGHWDQCIHLFWKHTPNNSGYIPSLMLNHPRPREKPGSRYVAQSNPKLKIADN